MSPTLVTGVHIRRGAFGHRREVITWRRQILEGCSHKPRDTEEGWKSPEAGKGRKDPPLEPSDRARP